MMDQSYLQKGLMALANASEQNVFTGHYGAAFIAAYFMDRENQLPDHVTESITSYLARVEEKQTKFFINIDKSPSVTDDFEPLLRAIKRNLEVLRSSGHGVIYGMLALKAFQHAPQLATELLVQRIAQLIDKALQDRQNRYYQIENYQILTEKDVLGIPVYQSMQDLMELALAECRWVIPDQKVGDDFYFFTGELEHGVTFAHALVELEKMEYKELARHGWHVHRLQMYLNRQVPHHLMNQVVIVSDKASILDEGYWKKEMQDPHFIKVPYAALSLLKNLPTHKRKIAEHHICQILSTF
ncbi:hypothetical protein IC619_008385 [Hazenella sp. IB182353]|uniref:hypothetical protein n=1 Tax=Polycladospora coralii TaxID=2771432 RepID=UPI001745E0F0|nr:hypothetical protein [Polycladospora coralii]MBS7530506.1 hypothetical protein [Polycladospora coralii]